MKLNNASEKAIAVIAYLSINNQDQRVRSIDIATRLDLSDSYTKKILRKLVVAGIIDANSGNTGGYQLARQAKDINLLMIVEAMEGKIRTYPEHGVLANYFSDLTTNDHAEKADDTLKVQITQADDLWREAISKITVASIMASVFTK